jgi:glyoxylase-like metal-dependent hydrolase (beta-lactamase superfamily II)
MDEIVPDIFTWSWFSERHRYNFNGYLARYPSCTVCVDPVEMSHDVLSEIAKEQVICIILTNRNHLRASNKVRERTGAQVFIHPADAAYAVTQGAIIDDYLEIGQKIGPFHVLPAQGKSPGEIALHWPEKRVLVVGDACVGNPPGQCSLLPDRIMDDPVALRRSLRRLAAEVDFDALLVGDGTPLVSGGRGALQALVARFG